MDSPTVYRIIVKGHLDEALAGWFETLTIENLENGTAILSGPLQDQAALHGLLNRINSLGLTLISINAVPEEDGTDGRIQSHEDDPKS